MALSTQKSEPIKTTKHSLNVRLFRLNLFNHLNNAFSRKKQFFSYREPLLQETILQLQGILTARNYFTATGNPDCKKQFYSYREP